MNKKRTSRVLVIGASAVLLLGGVVAYAWLYGPGLLASWMVSRRTDSHDIFTSLIQMAEDVGAPYDVRVLALQRASKAYDPLTNFMGTIRVSTAGLALITNEANRSIIKRNARLHGKDPDEQVNLMRDLAFCMRGMAFTSLRRYEEALADLKQVSESGREQNGWRKAVGVSAYHTHRFALAAKELSEYLAVNDDEVSYHEMLAFSQMNAEQHEQALSNYLHVISIDAKRAEPYAYVAGILSTSKKDSLRDGERALEFADKGLSLTANPSPLFYDMKACALAELGRFDQAVGCAHMAVAGVPTDAPGERRNEEYKEALQKRVDSFKQGIPWRE